MFEFSFYLVPNQWQHPESPDETHTVGKKQFQHRIPGKNPMSFLNCTHPVTDAVSGILGQLLPDICVVFSSPAII